MNMFLYLNRKYNIYKYKTNMKKFTQLLEARTLDVQDNGINYIDADDLKKYLEITKNFLSDSSRTIIDYMIKNNKTYVDTLGRDDDKNCLISFYSRPRPNDPELKKIYNALSDLQKNNRLLEVPTLQTREQFNSIISGKEAPDSIILDLKSEEGRNALAKKWEKLVHKIAQQWRGKVNMTYDEIVSAAWEGFTNAMNSYGKKSAYKNTDDEKAVKTYTFGQYAAYMIRFAIAGEVNNSSRLVRVPISAISKEKKETGSITKNNTISGDKKVGSDDEGNKSLFDFIGGVDDGERALDQSDLDKLWADVYNILEKEFDKKVIEAWYSFMGLNGRDKLKNKEIANKIGCQPSLVTYYCNTVNNFIKNDSRVLSKMKEIYELMKECLHDREHDDDLIEDGLDVKEAINKNNNDDEQ